MSAIDDIEKVAVEVAQPIADLALRLAGFPDLVAPLGKIVDAFLRHDNPVAEAERQAEIIAAKEAIRVPFKE